MALAAVFLLPVGLAVVSLAWYAVNQAKGSDGQAKVGFRIAGIHFTYEKGERPPNSNEGTKELSQEPQPPPPDGGEAT